MEKVSLPKPKSPFGQRLIYKRVREVVDLLADQSEIARNPGQFGRAEWALWTIYEQADQEAIFCPFVKHQIGEKKLALLEQHYADWQKTRATA